MDSVIAEEAQRQRRRDFQTNTSTERTVCLACGTIVKFSVDGRCVPCYDLRAVQIFGVGADTFKS